MARYSAGWRLNLRAKVVGGPRVSTAYLTHDAGSHQQCEALAIGYEAGQEHDGPGHIG